MSRTNAIGTICDDSEISEPPGWSAYFDLARAWGERTDLTSARSDVELAEILFLDAAQVIREQWVPSSGSLVDVGAGVGAPTIPILLSGESLRGTLVEPRRIRTAFLRTATGALGLTGRSTTLEQRIDPSRPEVPGAPFSVALSRATFVPERWLGIGAQLAPEVWVLTAGTVPPGAEGRTPTRRIDYEVPSSGAPRSILAYCR